MVGSASSYTKVDRCPVQLFKFRPTLSKITQERINNREKRYNSTVVICFAMPYNQGHLRNLYKFLKLFYLTNLLLHYLKDGIALCSHC